MPPPTPLSSHRLATALCARCERLFTDSGSLHRLIHEESVPHGHFSDLDAACSLCSLVKKRLIDAAHNDGIDLDPRTETCRLSAILMFQDSDMDDDDERAPDFESTIPSALFFYGNEESSEKQKLSAGVDWYSIPATIPNRLGLGMKGAESVSHWKRLAGLYTSEEYWKDPSFAESIMRMVTDCRANHTNCGGKETGVLPTMVLDVSSASRNGRIFLHTARPQERGDYIALSYCWGGPQKVTTTMGNRAEHHRQGIPVAALPRTLTDAIRVTMSLGVRFLWVDALCIVQDDDTSKAREIEKMGDIYTNSIMVLIAGGLTRKVDDGFLVAQDDFAIVPIRVSPDAPAVLVALAPGDMESGHIESRGWTFQERLLASRTLEFRAARGVSYSCSESFTTFVGGAGPDGTDAWVPDERKLAEKISVSASSRGLWHAMLEEYSVRRLTEMSDRLPALAGFARAWAARKASSSSSSLSSPDEYMAGLWKSQLIDDLMWRSGVQLVGPEARIGLDTYRRPGWSWTSVLDHHESALSLVASFVINPQRRRIGVGGHDEDCASLVRHSVLLEHADAPFGRVIEGQITLRAQVALIPRKFDDKERMDRRRAVLGECDYRLSDQEVSRLLMLRLKTGWQWDVRQSGRGQRGDGGLLILPSDGGGSGDENTYKRVGCFWDWTCAEEGIPLVDWDAVQFVETTLV